MPDQVATGAVPIGAAPRVVLLARAGKAADNLAEALREAGAELLFVGDPANTDEAALRAQRPQAVLVALEPNIEPALDRLDGLLSDPELTVIFDEADLAAHRAGWDAARWARHLAAKLRHDTNVLPPGAENDQDWQPSPGGIPKPAAAHADADLADFAREAVAHADRVPVDGAPSDAPPALVAAASVPMDAALIDAIPSSPANAAPPRSVPPPLPPSGFELEALEAELRGTSFLDAPSPPASTPVSADSVSFDRFASASPDDASIEAVSLDSYALDDISLESMPSEGMQLEAMPPEDLSLESARREPIAFEDAGFDLGSLDGIQLEEVALDDAPAAQTPELAPMRFDDDAFFLEELSATTVASEGSSVAPIDFDSGFQGDFSLDAFEIDDAAPADGGPTEPRPARVVEEVLSFEELIAASMPAAQDLPASSVPASSVPASNVQTAEPPRSPAADPSSGFSIGDLSLAAFDDAPASVETAKSPAFAPDLSALEARISGLSLVDIEDAAADPSSAFGASFATGVVLVEAGLGGPDPVRQLLAALPAEFPAVVLVRLHLQGGRYDRLVAQMERAASLPVALAEAGATANPGTIYFLPEGVGLAARGVSIGFVADPAPAAGMFAALPPKNSALVFLSGSDPQLVDVAVATAAAGTLVIAQSAEDCYDGTACADLRARGVASALPVELAGRLASRWPSSRSD
jgi:chemotaxis response regulator CheB